ncbi:hypothetical protein FV222_03695 [Methylobacterium sp. WL103]|uniref:hypothetical protein n=1 Tax=Methylobacterium sp. WL103 TaxID=2603891 RepID=UPI0011CA3E7F|nr:hypothetical protein [Methylobacterium sp. WL103]TXN07013.1 hypothetical protein FV222_03695 [Methylobacterium sp. WL103]
MKLTRALISSSMFVAAMALTVPVHAEGLTKEEAQVNIAAISSFVNKFCSGMRVDGGTLQAAMTNLGTTIEEFTAKENRVAQTEVMVTQMAADKATSCDSSWKLFGESGTILPGLLRR